MNLSLEALIFIIRTSWLILEKVKDLVNYVTICLSHRTLLRLLTFLLGFLTVTITVLFFWIFLSSDPSICSTVAFPFHWEIHVTLLSQLPLTFL